MWNVEFGMWNVELVGFVDYSIMSYSIKIIIQYSLLISIACNAFGRGLYCWLISFALIAHWCISTSFSKIKHECPNL
jgi:hypothetical protein